MYVRPIGLAGLPPPGPETPVIATAMSAPVRSLAPSAIERATWALTAPWAASCSAGTPSRRTLASSA